MKNQLIQIDTLLDPFIAEGCRTISVAGSGGKTTFVRKAALYYASKLHVGVAASTKMFLPDDEWMVDGVRPPVKTPEKKHYSDAPVPGLCFYTDNILQEGKIAGIGEEMLRLALSESELLLIEADGSNRKPLKGWRKDEPVIVEKTDVTVGILPLHCLDHRLDETMVHRMEAFTALTGLSEGDTMTVEAYEALIRHPNGLFGHASGKKLLILNRVDSECLWQAARQIAAHCVSDVYQTVIGCLKNE
jgi:probable selenium-dependent hydroxylase accessory protein YqeC